MAAHATAKGTGAFAQRFGGRLAAGHFRAGLGLQLSSIGFGTYRGDADRGTDLAYRQAVACALQRGCNVIDSAVNYRFQRSERAIGDALAHAFAAGTVRRDEIVVATKGGYLSFDSTEPHDPGRWFYDTFVTTDVASADDLVAGCHCMTPAYLRHQLATSLRNLQLDCVDIYYLHNPETQLTEVPPNQFRSRMRAAFAQLEEAAAAGHLRAFGIATWSGLRQPEGARDHVSLQELVRLAEDVGGKDHHFRAIQAPFNLAMPEALTRRNQRVDGELMSLLSAAAYLGITVFTSATILQGQLSRRLPAALSEILSGFETDAQRAIQFVRSTPGVRTALIGMKQVSHVEENLATARVPPLGTTQFARLFADAPE